MTRHASAALVRAAPGAVTDFDIHGLLGVRLIDASPGDERAVLRQLGDLRASLAREPDLTLRFVERIETRELRYVEAERSGFTDDGFLILQARRQPVRMCIPFDAIGGPCTILCEHGARSVPMLLPLIELAALQRGIVPLHASAFELNGRGVLVGGWAHGGKTSALLAFAGCGARYVGDDVVLLSDDGRRMAGLPAPIEVSAAQLAQLDHLRGPQLQVHVRRWLDGIARRTAAATGTRAVPAALLHRMRRRLRSRVPVEAIFGDAVSLTAEPHTIFLAMSHAGTDISIVAADPDEIAERMAHAFRREIAELFLHYLAFRFAFPALRNAALENAHAVHAALLRSALHGRQAWVIRHPYPVRPADLFAAMRPFCAASRAAPMMEPLLP